MYRLMALIAIGLVAVMAYAGSLNETSLTVAAAGTTTVFTPSSGNKAAVRSIFISVLNSCRVYMFEGVAGAITKKFPDMYIPAYGTIAKGTDTNPLNWVGTKDTVLKIWFSAAPGASDHSIGVRVENQGN